MSACRLARCLVYTGLAAIVFGLSKVHAAYIADPPYDYTGSFRFTWSLAYIGGLYIAAYGAGLPDLPRSRRSTWLSALAAPLLAAGGVSVLQLVVGDALLPRFVVFGAALLAVPWLAGCAALAQRVKLASELAKRSTGHTIYVLDEPTTGLHFEDIRRLLTVLGRLVDQGNTVLVIEHNLDVIKTADWIIDLGPEGGDGGGTVVVEGTPELVAKTEASHTGRFLAPLLEG